MRRRGAILGLLYFRPARPWRDPAGIGAESGKTARGVARGENRRMKIFGIAGHSGMGKTTLLERLLPALAARGLAVSTIKHSHKDIEVDRPGKDSHRLRDAGSREVLLLGSKRWALMHELAHGEEPPLDELLVQYDDDELNRLGVPRLPSTLGEALDVFATDDVIRESVGTYIADQLLHVKKAEWLAYKSHVSPWEHLRYGDL